MDTHSEIAVMIRAKHIHNVCNLRYNLHLLSALCSEQVINRCPSSRKADRNIHAHIMAERRGYS